MPVDLIAWGCARVASPFKKVSSMNAMQLWVLECTQEIQGHSGRTIVAFPRKQSLTLPDRRIDACQVEKNLFFIFKKTANTEHGTLADAHITGPDWEFRKTAWTLKIGCSSLREPHPSKRLSSAAGLSECKG